MSCSPIAFCWTLLIILLAAGPIAVTAQVPESRGRWTAAVELGELPMHGSFKLGLSVGYHLDDLAWVGVAYQMPDAIARDATSFNANSLRLEGLETSRERVGKRAYLQTRLRPHRHAPFVSLGLVFNDRDTETIGFDARPRTLGDETARGELLVRVSRPAALRPAIGAGYEWSNERGLTAFVEWSGWWLRGAPDPDVTIEGESLPSGFAGEIGRRLSDHFTSSLFNTYHIFQLGVGITR